MPVPPHPRNDPSGRLLVLLLVAVMCGFVLTSVVAQRTSAEVASYSETIASTSSPSVERLALLRGLVFQVELNLSEYLRTGAARETERRAFETSLDSLERTSESYLVLPLLPGEQPYWGETQAALVRFDSSVRSTAELARAGEVATAQRQFSTTVRQAGERLVKSSLGGIEFHAQNSRKMATRIREARQRALLLANVLSAVCVALGIVGLLLVLRQFRRHRALVEAHSRFHEARADELEQFAGRVAHDIRGPMSAASMVAQVALRRVGEGGGPKDQLARIVLSLSRADAIITGLLDFARSGAQPDPGARTNPSEVLHDLLRGVSPEAEPRGIEIELRPVPPVKVLCSPGVYLSLVGNLVRNALKYMHDASVRRVSVRVVDEGADVRTEVIDTGPGIASVDLPSLFEPYFRVDSDRRKDGIGLGLATVKKLAEGHHGSVGVTSEPGRGSTFWFTLPRAGTPDSSQDSESDTNESGRSDGSSRPDMHH
jgi:signal transduction histidine kinase